VEGLTLVQDFDRNSGAPRYQEFRRLYGERFIANPTRLQSTPSMPAT